jgi:N-acetylneuraminic acid mutarotase
MIASHMRRVAQGSRVLALGLVLAVGMAARAGVPSLVDFQGTLTDASGAAVTGTASLVFSLYPTATGGTALWQETQTVNVAAGIYSTGLGSVTPLPDSLWASAALWLGVRQNGAAELPQRIRIVAVPYALRAKTAESVVGGGSGGSGGALPAGAMVLSATTADPALLAAGFVELYAMRPECWRAISVGGNAPSTFRTWHTAVWTGSRMIVWGGVATFFGGTDLNTGGAYDPATDTWTATATVDAPTARSGHTAVWTGSRMIVWGGRTDADPDYYKDSKDINIGGVYDPATDTWTATSTVDAPTARSGHTAVWTGSRMIVWGGDLTDTGGAYDPATDTWTATATVNAPTARSGHTAVWTGSRMIVWGGRAGAAYGDLTDTGDAYDPATDTWTATSTVNAPTARGEHTAVWTGSRMIVWGGDDGTVGYLDTGGIYDPAADAWTATSTVDAPMLQRHLAVWTGSRMIVWLGPSLSGVYDPVRNTWTALSETNAPHSTSAAVWTGSRMIVWGGNRFTGERDSGVYDPASDRLLYIYQKP